MSNRLVEMKQFKIMVIFGTRPEAIKMAPVICQIKNYSHEFQMCIVVTAQHRSMLDQVLEIFHIEPDYDLDIMLPDQSLTETTVRALSGLEDIIRHENPDLVLVQGDTTTAFVGGLAAFYHQIPIGHIEAGLRTWDKYNPYPEEINRHLLDVFTDLHFAPTLTAKDALLKERIPESRILVTGNTVIDALLTVISHTHPFTVPSLKHIKFDPSHITLLVTTHRRENLGAPIKNICFALRDLLIAKENLQVVFPMHLNPKVRQTVLPILGDMERAWLVEPLGYLDFVHLMKCADVILTDSGGVQEEAPALGKPVLVTRMKTERPEAIEAGTARLVGTARQDIVAAVLKLLDDPAEYARMKHAINPYGDGHAAQRITDSIRHFFGFLATPPLPFRAELLLSDVHQA